MGDVFGWLWHRKVWWLVPIVLALGIVGGLMWFGGTAAAPFIYPLF